MPTVEKPAAEKCVPTSLKLPASLKAQIDDSARKAGISAHAFMVKAISETAERMRLREQFTQDALDALRHTEATGLAYEFDDVRDYFAARARGENPARPVLKPWR